MGRKKKPDYLRKTEVIKIRMRKSDVDILKKICEKKKIGVSDFFRSLLFEYYLKNMD